MKITVNVTVSFLTIATIGIIFVQLIRSCHLEIKSFTCGFLTVKKCNCNFTLTVRLQLIFTPGVRLITVFET
jgi:hypothetical protein